MDEQADEFAQRAQGRVGTTLRGKYTLDKVLGVGGMAVVFAATHRNQAQFAVKMLHPELSMNADVRTRFLREGYAANSVKHPGAVLVVDDDVAEDGAAFLVMELLQGVGVEALWEKSGNRLPLRVVLSIGYQLLDVLAVAHDKGIVHRDIKPANLFITTDGTLKVLDFGIARVKDSANQGAGRGTGSGLLLGTPAFMAPEQAYAKASEIDAQTDVWAVGATLFTLLTGVSVHEGDNAAQLMIRAATSHARSLSTVIPDAPPSVGRVVDTALAFDKASRTKSASAMRDAIEAASLEVFGDLPSKDTLVAALAGKASVDKLPLAAQTAPTLPIGGSTARPVIADPHTAAAPLPASSTSPKRRMGVIVGIAAVAVLGAAFLATGFRSKAPVAGATQPVAPESATHAVTAVAEPVVQTTAQSTATAEPLAAAVTTPRQVAVTTVSKVTDHGSPTKAALASASPSATSANCNPNYYLDANGEKHFKRECFQHP